MTRTLDAELALDAQAVLGEGPAWDKAQGQLLWVDITASRLHRYDPATGTDSALDTGSHIGAVVPHAEGGHLAALREGPARIDGAGRRTLLADLARPGIRMNDGTCAPDGAFWFGSMAYDKTPGAGTLYRLAPDGTVETKVPGVTISNGIAFTPGGERMYYVDTPTRRIDVFDIEPATQTPRHRRAFADLSARGGLPDGLTLDDDGCLWVALYKAGSLHRYTPDGTLDTVIRLPVHHPTSCAFGGFDGQTLFITSGQAPAGSPATPLDGGLFAVHPGVSGPPAIPYRPQSPSPAKGE